MNQNSRLNFHENITQHYRFLSEDHSASSFSLILYTRRRLLRCTSALTVGHYYVLLYASHAAKVPRRGTLRSVANAGRLLNKERKERKGKWRDISCSLKVV